MTESPTPLLPQLASLLPLCGTPVALTGGGGKTGLMNRLARHLVRTRAASRVLLTTTTKIGVPRGGRAKLLLGPPSADDLASAFAGRHILIVGEAVMRDKIRGVPPAYFDALAATNAADYLFVEADGAKRLPFKAYESYEPVIPSRTALQIVVVGAEILLAPPSEANTFRYPLFRERWGDCGGAPLSFGLLARILESEKEYLKGAAPLSKRILLINKCDLLARDFPDRLAKAAKELSSRLTRYDCLILGSIKEDKLYAFSDLRRGARR